MGDYAYRVAFSYDDAEFVATVAEFPSLSFLAPSEDEALAGLREIVAGVEADLADEAERGYDITQLRPRRRD